MLARATLLRLGTLGTCTLLLATCLASVAVWASSGDVPAARAFVVVVNAGAPTTAFSPAQIASIFLRRTTRFADGTAMRPFDQPPTSAVRRAFSLAILHRSVDGVEEYWQQELFGGRAVPPRIVADERALIELVGATPGGFAYLAPQPVSVPLPVSVVAVTILGSESDKGALR